LFSSIAERMIERSRAVVVLTTVGAVAAIEAGLRLSRWRSMNV